LKSICALPFYRFFSISFISGSCTLLGRLGFACGFFAQKALTCHIVALQ
jgi:hypothetical protein